jgi:hypothetical protein
MRAPAWAVPVLAISACAAPAAPHAAPTPRNEIAATWEVERSDPASSEFELAYVVAACTVLKRLGVVEEAARIVVTLDLGGREGKDCTEPVRKHRVVRLRTALGDRPLYDGGVSPPTRVYTDTKR